MWYSLQFHSAQRKIQCLVLFALECIYKTMGQNISSKSLRKAMKMRVFPLLINNSHSSLTNHCQCFASANALNQQESIKLCAIEGIELTNRDYFRKKSERKSLLLHSKTSKSHVWTMSTLPRINRKRLVKMFHRVPDSVSFCSEIQMQCYLSTDLMSNIWSELSTGNDRLLRTQIKSLKSECWANQDFQGFSHKK